MYDSIVAEVRQNRENLLAEFGGDIGKLDAHIEKKRRDREVAGAHYVTEEERLARIEYSRQRREAEEYRVASLNVG